MFCPFWPIFWSNLIIFIFCQFPFHSILTKAYSQKLKFVFLKGPRFFWLRRYGFNGILLLSRSGIWKGCCHSLRLHFIISNYQIINDLNKKKYTFTLFRQNLWLKLSMCARRFWQLLETWAWSHWDNGKFSGLWRTYLCLEGKKYHFLYLQGFLC